MKHSTQYEKIFCKSHIKHKGKIWFAHGSVSQHIVNFSKQFICSVQNNFQTTLNIKMTQIRTETFIHFWFIASNNHQLDSCRFNAVQHEKSSIHCSTFIVIFTSFPNTVSLEWTFHQQMDAPNMNFFGQSIERHVWSSQQPPWKCHSLTCTSAIFIMLKGNALSHTF